MLRRILAGFAVASLLVCLIALIFWWRSFSHIDHVGFRGIGGGRCELTTNHGTLMVTTTNNFGNLVSQRASFYAMRQVVGGCLLLPALWLAVKVRSLLPRPGSRRHPVLAGPGSSAGKNGAGRGKD